MTAVAIVHDYLTQRGGAERVVLSMLKAFPNAPLHTSLFDPDGTFPEFTHADVRTLPLNRFPLFRGAHRLAFPLLAAQFSSLYVDADVVLCSSSGWAHGIRTTGSKVVYCHTPARWLYQTERYLGGRRLIARTALKVLRSKLTEWDRVAAASAFRYLTQSTTVRDRIRALYSIEAELLPAPVRLGPSGDTLPVPGLEPGFFLCTSRLLPYKNVDAVVSAFAQLPACRLAVAGGGPQESRLRRAAGRNVTILGRVSDPELRWLYASSAGLVAASYEDYGLTPLEAAAHGKPTAALRWGGFVDTVIEGKTGVFFDSPTPAEIAGAVHRLRIQAFSPDAIRAHARLYSEEAFIDRLREIVFQSAPSQAPKRERQSTAVGAVLG